MKTRSIIASALIGLTIAAGAASTGVANASVRNCGWGMVPDTQGGVTACKQMPVTPGRQGHRARAHKLAQMPPVTKVN